MAIHFNKPQVSLLAFLLFLLLWSQAGAFQNPVDQPSQASAMSAHAPLFGVVSVGKRLIAVGVRGHIVISDDGGESWRQAVVPVSTDIVAVSFPTESDGWAVGHGGVVLHSADGGETWVKQMSGRQSLMLALDYYESPSDALQREKALVDDSGTPSFLDVHFENERVGYVVGAFNQIYRTEDGGKTWVPWMHRTDNPQELHFYGVRGRGGDWYLVGEQGVVWRLDQATNRFLAMRTPYKGTLFGLMIDSANRVFVYGMRGSFFHSTDQGRTWAGSDTGTIAGITGAVELPDGRIVLSDQAGGYSVSDDHGKSFVAHRSTRAMPSFGAASLSNDELVLVGSGGARVEALKPATAARSELRRVQ